MSDIITDAEFLKKDCARVDSAAEGEAIAAQLIKVLDEQTNAIGIAANQIGIDKKVCVVRVGRVLVFVNPVLTSCDGEIFFKEGCLSFPGETIRTKRHFSVSISADNHEEILHFTPHDSRSLLESVCVQHEIDHLNGIVMHDRQEKVITI